MNKDQIKGRVKEATGKAEENAGQVAGNRDLEDRGTGQKIGGKVQKTYGDVKEDIKEDLDENQ